jgi:hypothetical protein
MDVLFGLNLDVDELSLWNRALSLDDFATLAARYNFTTSNESLPPIPTLVAAGDEQNVGLPVHMLEAANADLKLVQAYVTAETNVIYTQCMAGQHNELDLVLGRVGQSLRLASVIGDEAASVVAATGTSTPWYPRYQADLTELGGRRAQLISALEALQGTDCKNTLSISEGDLPLYVGSSGPSAAERFFASSRFLANTALNEITVAGGETGSDGLLGQARNAYNAARSSQFQEDQGVHDSAGRILKINTDYEDQLKRYCGAPVGEDVEHGQFRLLQGFQNGTLTASNCYLKSELPRCAGLENTPFAALPSECLRGEMGERLLAIQAARVDAENADHAAVRVLEEFGAEMGYCARLKEQLDGDLELLNRHLEHMWHLTMVKQAWSGDLTTRIFSFGAALMRNFPSGFGDFVAFNFSVDRQVIQEQNAYELEKAVRGSNASLEACYQKADLKKFAFDAARDTIRSAAQQTRAAALAFADAANLVAALAAEGAGQLAIESTINRTPPHLHYWLDQSISSYHAHMAYARRLTYLAVRAFEYESQQSSTLRDAVLNAQLPDDLKTVASTILGATAPFAGRRIDSGPLVLSLRDDVLHMLDLSQNSLRVNGTAPLTPIEAFRQLLTSDATRIYDRNGHYVGHGIRFSLRPEPVDAQSCAERLSRIVPSVTLENASQEITHTRLVLAATNTFGSQVCGATPGTLQLARIQPSQSLLVGDAVQTFPDPSPFSTTGLFPLINTSRDTLRNMTFPSDDPSGFAGRGRYGDYILIFPDDPQACTPTRCDGWSPDALDKVNDVLLRFDLVEQDNTHL